MNILKFCEDFLENVLKNESWFKKMLKFKDCDLLILTGSIIKSLSDKNSDIDIFLVCSQKNQIKYSLKPIYLYKYEGRYIEISMVSTEKLINDQYNKDNIFWWHRSLIIKCFNKKIKKIFIKASTMSHKDFLDRIWTNFIRYNIYSHDIDKLFLREEYVGLNILINENIKLLIDTFLSFKNCFYQYKWFGKKIKDLNPLLYKEIQKINRVKNIKKLVKLNNSLRNYFIKILRENGFSDNEIKNWSEYNLNRITFQYR